MMRLLATALLTALVLGAASAAPQQRGTDKVPPAVHRVMNPISGSYIVALKPALGRTPGAFTNAVQGVSRIAGVAVVREYTFLAAHGFPAYSANLSAAALTDVVGRADVAFVEENGKTLPFNSCCMFPLRSRSCPKHCLCLVFPTHTILIIYPQLILRPR